MLELPAWNNSLHLISVLKPIPKICNAAHTVAISASALLLLVRPDAEQCLKKRTSSIYVFYCASHSCAEWKPCPAFEESVLDDLSLGSHNCSWRMLLNSSVTGTVSINFNLISVNRLLKPDGSPEFNKNNPSNRNKSKVATVKRENVESLFSKRIPYSKNIYMRQTKCIPLETGRV